ncbi:ATP-binding cassette sub- G member 1 [Phlyctochytrium planicorne]|nr:ATP-binding cassette sub- G member 1 [Phlyctochytrium planicorne]
MPNKLPPRDMRVGGSRNTLEKRLGTSQLSMQLSRSQVLSTPDGRGDNLGSRAVNDTAQPSNGHGSVDSLSKRQNVNTNATIADDFLKLDKNGWMVPAPNPTSSLSPAVSKAMLGASREGLGSSFQLTHVVPEEDESRVITRVPSGLPGSEGKDGGSVKSLRQALPPSALVELPRLVGEIKTEVEVKDVVADEQEEKGRDWIVEEDEEEGAHGENEGSGQSAEGQDRIGDPDLDVNERPSIHLSHKTSLPLFETTTSPSNPPPAKIDPPPPHYNSKSSLGLQQDKQARVVFKNLGYSVTVKEGKVAKQKDILKGVTGEFRPGRLTAIMGASGAGKTSLLNVIAGEAKIGTTSGGIFVHGCKMSGAEIRTLSGFVFQDDVIFPTMTVREAITMSAHLRLPTEMPDHERSRRVEDVIEELNLRRAEATPIGTSEFKGGLDSFTAFSVMRTLKALAKTGRTIIATLHQPSSEIFRLFDDLVLMAEGRIMYQGPAANAVSYFGRLGYPCPKNSNPPDYFFMSILNTDDNIVAHRVDGDNAMLTSSERILKLLNAWDESDERQKLFATIDEDEADRPEGLRTMRSFLTQIKFLYMRASQNAMRDPLVLRSKLVQVSFISLLIGLLYLRTDLQNGNVAMQNRIGVLFFFSVTNIMTASTANLTVFAREKPVFLREHRAGYYGVTAYFIGKFFAELPLYVLFPTLQTIIVYFMVGLQPQVSKVIISCIINIMLSLVGMALGIYFACCFSSLKVSLAATPLVIMPMMLFSGMFVNTGAMQAWISWIAYLSPVKYGFEALARNEFQGLEIRMDAPANVVAAQIAQGKTPTLYTTVYGETQLALLGFYNDGLEVATCIIILFSMTVALVLAAFFSLHSIAKGEHKDESTTGPKRGITMNKKKKTASASKKAVHP